jgi:hypothetical protein
MQAVKKLLLVMVVLLCSVSVAFGAMTTAQIQEKLEQGMDVKEVLELALISGATMDDVYAAAEAAQVPEGSSVAQVKAQITTAAVQIVAAAESSTNVGSTAEPAPYVLTFDQIVEASADADVPLTVAINAAPPEFKIVVAQAAVQVATAADGTEGSLTIQAVAVALLATGTEEDDLETALNDAGATTEQINTVDTAAASEQAVAEKAAAEELVPEATEPEQVAEPEPDLTEEPELPEELAEDPAQLTPPVDPPTNDCDTTVPSPSC